MAEVEQLRAENARLYEKINFLEQQNFGLLKKIKTFEELKGVYSNIVNYLNSDKSSMVGSEIKDDDVAKFKFSH
jgi:hypothetical protein